MKYIIATMAILANLFAAAEEYRTEILLSGSDITDAAKIGNAFHSKIYEATLTTQDGEAFWNVTGTPGEKGFSELRVGCTDTKGGLVGMRFMLELAQPSTLTLGAYTNYSKDKGFWSTQRLSSKTQTFAAGSQNIDILWSDLKIKSEEWGNVSGAGISTGQPPFAAKIREIDLLYDPAQAATGGSKRVPWLDTANSAANPVARPLDKLTGVFSLQQGNGLLSKIVSIDRPDAAPAAGWSVSGQSLPDKKGWASYGFGLVDPVDPPPVGVVFSVTLSKPVTLNLEVCENFDRTRGFYTAKRVGQTTSRQLPVGNNEIVFHWQDFKVKPENYSRINAVRFVTGETDFTMEFNKIELLYDNLKDADTFRKIKSRQLRQLQKTMIAALEARKIPWSNALQELPPEKTEPLLWQGIMLSAQREQLQHLTRLTGQKNAALEQKNQELIDAGAAGKFKDLDAQTAGLQTQIDQAIDRTLATVGIDKRAWRYNQTTKQFNYPDGSDYRLYGPHFFRSQYPPGFQQWREWDLRYLAGLGFNGIRLQVVWNKLEPERGKFNQAYLDQLKAIIRTAERYGFAVSVDLHWEYPEWFKKGAPGFEPAPGKLNSANSYHWPEALVDSWTRLGKEIAASPNILAFEVPTNETPISNDPGGLTASPYLMKMWNQFLKEKYQTRENLQSVWSAAAHDASKYQLAPDESWDNDSILPLGFQGDAGPDDAYEYNPRLYDHLRFTAWLQARVSGDIVKGLRQTRPDAVGMFQRTIGDTWDKSPVKLNYRAVITSVGDNVLPGTHYGMGSLQARKAATLTRGSYDSEQQMENNQIAVRKQVELGLGFCPFAFHYRGGGGMLLADDDWHLKPEVGYLPAMADFVRNHQPAVKTGEKIAVIINSRQEATTGVTAEAVIRYLEERNCRVGVFESLRVITQPELLRDYQGVITSSNWVDPELLSLLKKHNGKVLLAGRLDLDAHNRPLPPLLVKQQLLLQTPEIRNAAENSGSIDLSGNWDFGFRTEMPENYTAVPDFARNETMQVPRMWGETGLTGSLKYRIGDGWYRHQITIPANWQGRTLKLYLGGVDDIDWVFFNGKLIGKTGENTPNYWMTPRIYTLPAELTRYGQSNTLDIGVRNLRNDGGIWGKPVKIDSSSENAMTALDGKTLPVPGNDKSTLVPLSSLRPEAKVLACWSIANTSYAAMVEDGNVLWYVNHQDLQPEQPGDRFVLDQFVESLQ